MWLPLPQVRARRPLQDLPRIRFRKSFEAPLVRVEQSQALPLLQAISATGKQEDSLPATLTKPVGTPDPTRSRRFEIQPILYLRGLKGLRRFPTACPPIV